MIGGAPILPPAPVYANPYPASPYAAAPRQQAPWPNANWQQSSANAPTGVQQGPRPLFRGKVDDPPAPRAIRSKAMTMPTPEELGILRAVPAHVAAVDWAGAHQRLTQLGATCFHLEKLPHGDYKFICFLPTPRPDCTHRVEVQGASEMEVVRLALEKSEAWAGGR
jgi:hypothetical protein